MLYEVRSANAKRLKLGAVHTSLDPLVNGLTGHGRIEMPARLFNTMVVTHSCAA